MAYYLTKITITVILVVVISEVSKRSSFIAAVLASVPLVSVLAMIWLYVDTEDSQKVVSLATSIAWLVLPSLSLFIALCVLLKHGVNFYLSMGFSVIATIICYYGMVMMLARFGVKL